MEWLDSGVRCHLLEFVDSRELGCVSATSRDWRSRTEYSARLRVGDFLRRIGVDGLATADQTKLGFEAGTAWRSVLAAYSKCLFWLRADAKIESDEDGRVLSWGDALGSGAAARPARVGDAPRLVVDDKKVSTVDFGQQRGGRGLVLSGLPNVSMGVVVAVSAVSGDSTVVDSGESGGERFELCHGYPTDGNREQPRICFTASNSGDPPMRALWGETRSTGDRHVYSLVFGHKSWKRTETAPRPSEETLRRLLGGSPVARRLRHPPPGADERAAAAIHDDAPRAPPPPAVSPPAADPPGLTIFGPRVRRTYQTRHRAAATNAARDDHRSAALFVDSVIEACADVGPNGVARGFTIGSDRNGVYRLRGDLTAFALWNGTIPASCLFALERALIAKYHVKLPDRFAPRPVPNRPRSATN